MIEKSPTPFVLKQAEFVVDIKIAKDVFMAHKRAETCGCGSCRGEARKIVKFYNLTDQVLSDKISNRTPNK